MKFGESLSEGLVPEWKDQYVNYKKGKKLIKSLKAIEEERLNDVKPPTPVTKTDANDRTPLLEPEPSLLRPLFGANTNQDINGTSVRSGSASDPEDFVPTLDELPALPPPSKRRGSIFDFSSRSKEKKDDLVSGEIKFQEWLNSELSKVDHFFKEKEQEAYERFLLLQDQLYQLRDHKATILAEKSSDIEAHKVQIPNGNKVNDFAYHTKNIFTMINRFELPSLPSLAFIRNLKRKSTENDISMSVSYDDFDPNYAENRIRNGVDDISNRTGTDLSSIDSEESRFEQPPDRPRTQTPAQAKQVKRRDYSSKKASFGVPYLYARKQLKEATLEHYRALSLLSSFRVLNRTAFRKIAKKFDKTLETSISEDFMKNIDEHSYFQTSDLVDKLTNHVEELFIAFYDPETTDRKHSLEKLKSIAFAMNNSELRQRSYYSTLFTSGLLIGFGFPLFVLGLHTALSKTLSHELPEGRYLLQIWAGFFLIDLVFLLLGVNLYVFDKFKINYKFIFEFDLATALDYKQFLLLPSFGFALLSVLIWFSFNDFWPDKFPGRDWPWIYFGVMLVVFFWPGRQFYASSRKWLQVALWRLFLSGFYPVEFRDFFPGDILCSLTYAMGNLSFFFCLYAYHWKGLLGEGSGPAATNCGSSSSKAMGFLSTLPSIWRFLQCMRRYMDTGDWFPHLANMLKYGVSSLYYCLLSVYRIHRKPQDRIAFIVVASVNSIYCAAWDIVMDWSLLQSGSKHPYLRDNLFYKKPIYYYFAIVADIILRFQWVFYAFFSNQIQQSAITSFFIALAEVFRRFIWICFRMENEHCTNVILFRASKDSPLPYSISSRIEKAIKKLVELRYHEISLDSEVLNPRTPSAHGTKATSFINYPLSQGSGGRSGSGTGFDEESEVGVRRVATGSSFGGGHVARRRSAFINFGEALNKAHIKDFQRKKAPILVDDDSDEDDDAAETIERLSVRRKSMSSRPSQIYSLRE